jgi:hypothetical protein
MLTYADVCVGYRRRAREIASATRARSRAWCGRWRSCIWTKRFIRRTRRLQVLTCFTRTNGLALLVQKDLLYSYKRTCFTGTKVHILTPEELQMRCSIKSASSSTLFSQQKTGWNQRTARLRKRSLWPCSSRYQTSIQALLMLYQGSIEALLRLCESADRKAAQEKRMAMPSRSHIHPSAAAADVC